jgi:uncharacterized protein YneF (UPF0154 family)
MRYSEIASLPGTPEEAKNSVLDIMAVYQGNGKSEIPINVVMKTLHKQNFDIDRRLLINLIKDEPPIKRISGDMIYLDTEDEDTDVVSKDEGEKSKEKVEQMAKKAIDIGET